MPKKVSKGSFNTSITLKLFMEVFQRNPDINLSKHSLVVGMFVI